MVAVALDTHRAVKRLRDAGFEQLDQRLHGMEERYDRRLESLEQRMNGRFESLEQRMTIKLGSMLVAGVALVAGLVKLL